MAVLKMNIPDNILPEMVAALCSHYHYPATVLSETGAQVPNPQSRVEFARAQIIGHLRKIYVGYKSTIAIADLTHAAQVSASQEADGMGME